MNRIVLALLALFAGIAAQVSPAEARVRGNTEIGAVHAQRAAVRAATAQQVAVVLAPLDRQRPLTDEIETDPQSGAAPLVPVRLGCDRALE